MTLADKRAVFGVISLLVIISLISFYRISYHQGYVTATMDCKEGR